MSECISKPKHWFTKKTVFFGKSLPNVGGVADSQTRSKPLFRPVFHLSFSQISQKPWGGWMGKQIWERSPKKRCFFWTPSLKHKGQEHFCCFKSRKAWEKKRKTQRLIHQPTTNCSIIKWATIQAFQFSFCISLIKKWYLPGGAPRQT